MRAGTSLRRRAQNKYPNIVKLSQNPGYSARRPVVICCPVRRPVAKSALFTSSDGQIVYFSRGKEMGLTTKRGFMESFKMAKIKKMPAQSAKKQSGVRKRTRRGKVAIHVQRRGHFAFGAQLKPSANSLCAQMY